MGIFLAGGEMDMILKRPAVAVLVLLVCFFIEFREFREFR